MDSLDENKPLLTKGLPTKLSSNTADRVYGEDELKSVVTTSQGPRDGSIVSGDKYTEHSDEPPPPYETAIRIVKDPIHQTRTVTCRVCQNAIDINGKEGQFVVKCSYCGEATPIQNAPPGKKYVRCPCNCLLVCKISSQRIACPRPNCRGIINLDNRPAIPPPTQPGMCRVSCRHCEETFLFDTLQNALARCPHCQKVSSVGHEFARGRGTLFLLVGGIIFAIALVILLIATGSASHHPVLTILYILLFIVALVALCRSIYYYTMKVSEIEEFSQ